MVQTAERGLFTAMFLGDSQRLREHLGRVTDTAVTGRPDQPVLFAHLAARTERIGFVATLDATFLPPAELARRTATVEALSGGRLGWNVVTTDNAWTPESSGSATTPTATATPRTTLRLGRGRGEVPRVRPRHLDRPAYPRGPRGRPGLSPIDPRHRPAAAVVRYRPARVDPDARRRQQPRRARRRPTGFDDIVERLVPTLLDRGVHPTEYPGTTLHENLGLEAPVHHRLAAVRGSTTADARRPGTLAGTGPSSCRE